MTVFLETQQVFGDTIVAALVRNVIEQYHSSRHVAVTGSRTPLAVLIRAGDRVEVFTPQGDALTIAQIQALYPDAVAQFLSTDL